MYPNSETNNSMLIWNSMVEAISNILAYLLHSGRLSTLMIHIAGMGVKYVQRFRNVLIFPDVHISNDL